MRGAATRGADGRGWRSRGLPHARHGRPSRAGGRMLRSLGLSSSLPGFASRSAGRLHEGRGLASLGFGPLAWCSDDGPGRSDSCPSGVIGPFARLLRGGGWGERGKRGIVGSCRLSAVRCLYWQLKTGNWQLFPFLLDLDFLTLLRARYTPSSIFCTIRPCSPGIRFCGLAAYVHEVAHLVFEVSPTCRAQSGVMFIM